MTEKDLYNALIEASETSQDIFDYYPARFLMMLQERGALAGCVNRNETDI